MQLDEGTWVNVGDEPSHAFGGLGDGSHTAYIRAIDRMGNSKEDPVTFTVNTSFIGALGWTDDIALFGILIVIAALSVFFVLRRRASP